MLIQTVLPNTKYIIYDDYKYKLAKIFSNFIVEFVKELFAGMCISYHLLISNISLIRLSAPPSLNCSNIKNQKTNSYSTRDSKPQLS